MPYGTVNADVIGTSVAGSNLGAGNASIMKNRIINGAMVIDQRNNGASVTPSGGSPYVTDRWGYDLSQSSKLTAQQNAGAVTPPVGFSNYLGTTSSSAYSISSTDYFALRQTIEGFNIADLNWGTANAKTVTLSFQVYSSLTGTFGGALRNSTNNYSYPFSYSIPVANTWTSISITIAGPTGGTWYTDNRQGVIVYFGLGVGSTYSGTAGSWSANNYLSATGATSVVGTNGATFYITGVQLEVGSSATGYEYRQYGQELQLCQRYCYKASSSTANGGYNRYCVGANQSAVLCDSVFPFPVTMRTYPSLTTPAASQFAVYYNSTIIALSSINLDASAASTTSVNILAGVASGLGSGGASDLMSNNNNTSYLIFSAEL